MRENLAIREKIVIVEVLIDRKKIILRPLHIKLVLINEFAKVLNKDVVC